MPRPRKHFPSPAAGAPSSAASWVEQIGEALGRGVARGINSGLSGGLAAPTPGAARRGRPPKSQLGGPVPPDRMCTVPGCGSRSRSKGLCSRHYQAARRGALKR